MTAVYVEHVCVDKSTRPGAASICVECLGANDLENKRAGLFDDLGRAMAGAGIPFHLEGGLARYLVGGISPGHFLSAVLKNDLREAMARGDEESRAGLFSIVSFLYNKTPAPCSGSPEKVAAWCAMTDEERAASIGACLQ